MLSLKELSLKIGAEYRGTDMSLPPFSIDARTLQKGDVFVALRALRDGHQFVDQAIKAGAAAILVDQPQDVTIPQIIVKDTLKALGQLAHCWRKQFNIPVIGLTGSCGKTTTKEMIATILREQSKTLASEGNYNNAYGVPLTLLNLKPEHQFAVIEMGTNSPGEIAYIAQMVEPTVALITNIGASHLEKLTNFDGVSKEKSELFNFLSPTGIAILHRDEPFMNSWLPKIGDRHRLTYSITQDADVSATEIHYREGGVDFQLHTPIGVQAIKVPMSGQHIASNALAACATTLALGMSLSQIATGLSKMKEVQGRFKQHLLPNNCILIDDSYNASVSAVKNAIETLKQFQGHKVFVMSHLGELGEHTAHYHHEMGKWCKDAGFDAIYFYGIKERLDYALTECPKAHYFSDKAALITQLKKELKPSSMILIKGVHSSGMNEVVESPLKDHHA